MAKQTKNNPQGLSPHDLHQAARKQAFDCMFGYDDVLERMTEPDQADAIAHGETLNREQQEYAKYSMAQAQAEDAEIKKMDTEYAIMRAQFLQLFPDFEHKLKSIEEKGWRSRRDGAMDATKQANISRFL